MGSWSHTHVGVRTVRIILVDLLFNFLMLLRLSFKITLEIASILGRTVIKCLVDRVVRRRLWSWREIVELLLLDYHLGEELELVHI